MEQNKDEVSSPTTSGPDSDVNSVKEDELPYEEEGKEVIQDNDKVKHDLTDKMNAGANYLGSIFSNAWSKTAKTANTAASTAASGAVSASHFFSFATKPDEDEPVPETVTVQDEQENGQQQTEDENKEGGGEVEEESAGGYVTASSFLSAAMSKVSMFSSGGSAGDEQVSPSTEQVESTEEVPKESFYSTAMDFMGKATSYVDSLKDKVGNTSILGEFNKEQETFIKSKSMTNIENGLSPWIGYQREEELKAKILKLSEDKRNFVRAPPAGVTFEFDYSPQVYSVAMALLKEDEQLEAMRYELVPKKVKEDDFWRNYFYRVNLIQQSFDLNDFETAAPTTKSVRKKSDNIDGDLDDHSVVDDEFVSESFVASSKDMAEADASMQRLKDGISEADLEAELESELQEYEVVKDNSELDEEQIQKLLEAEDEKAKK